MSNNLRQYESGMVRGRKEEKIDYTLVLDGPMFERYARHMTNGGKVHGKRNWLKASGTAELEDFRAGFLRHAVQWLRGDTDEDHASACIFNLNGAELVKERLCTAQSVLARGEGVGSPSAQPLSETEIEAMRRSLENVAKYR